MASGGIYDHLGGGFARYSVDDRWLVPHFEKMLYDQALLTRAYLHAWQVTGHDRYRQVVEETVGYVLRDLRHPGGGFTSAEDADSEGEEGRFYVWTPDQVIAALGGDADLADDVMAGTGSPPAGNFEGRTILNRLRHRGDLDRPPQVEEAAPPPVRRPGAARPPRPGRQGAHRVERPDAGRAGRGGGRHRTGRLARTRRWPPASSCWARCGGTTAAGCGRGRPTPAPATCGRCRPGRAGRRLHPAGRGHRRGPLVAEAAATADALLDLFWDPARGGLFTTGADAEQLVARDKDLMDNATPSANSLAAVALVRLAALTGEGRYRHRADQILRLAGPVATRHPLAFGHLLAAVDLAVRGVDEVVVAGDRPDLVGLVQRAYLPGAVLAWGERYDSPLWAGRDDGRAYVCRGYACGLPAADAATLAGQLALAEV